MASQHEEVKHDATLSLSCAGLGAKLTAIDHVLGSNSNVKEVSVQQERCSKATAKVIGPSQEPRGLFVDGAATVSDGERLLALPSRPNRRDISLIATEEAGNVFSFKSHEDMVRSYIFYVTINE
eukprot:CAMPEP_0194054346 /NCGR_PEP_ID=MMETSP0009_2-20130614/53131_1 /TAXON_ID=210454 /ORGANISM="Grammatophora oceanica, Strain CCMP 410" /LENGTH=123 /DNA_ID=CAMNT_0038702797 /DNA_START=298 /DNA_END=669 /DNA_ORIENTATION=-